MKTLAKTLLAATFFIAFASCGNSESGQSTPIDSTVQNGTAPVQYSEGTPESTADTTIQQRDAMRGDTMNQGRGTATGNGTNSSNTSDARTTTGSANHGDADGDRKK